MLLFKKWSRFIGILFTLERQPIIAFQTENAFPTKQMLKPCKWNTMKHSEKQWNARYNDANETHDETVKMKHSEKKNNETHNITMQMKYTMNPCKHKNIKRNVSWSLSFSTNYKKNMNKKLENKGCYFSCGLYDRSLSETI